MMLLRRSLITLCLLLGPLGGHAPGQDDVAAVIDQHLDSRGGDDRILGLQGYVMRGTISQNGRAYPLQIRWKRPNKLRFDIGMGDNTVVSAYDGQTVWTVEPGPWGRQAAGVMPGLREWFMRQADFEGPLINSGKKGIAVTPDKSTWSAAAGYLFRIDRGTGATDELFVDPNLRQVAREVLYLGPPGFQHRVEQRYSKFRRIQGFSFPHRIERLVDDGSFDAMIDITEVSIVPAVDDSLFAMPAVRSAAANDTRLADLSDLTPVRERFAADAGMVRLVALLSPTSASSRQGLLEVQGIMDSIRDERVKAYIIWMPVVESDDRAAAASRTAECADARFAFFWDPKLVAAQQWQDVLDLGSMGWNLYLFHAGDATWEAAPPTPGFWMHQGVGKKNAPLLDRAQGVAKMRQWLAAAPDDGKKSPKHSER